jgi:RimJ/RimL family protein N-acetyltransferase
VAGQEDVVVNRQQSLILQENGMNNSLFQGELVRLGASDAKRDAELMARWSRDAEYLRQMDSDPARPVATKPLQDELEGELEDNNSQTFVIYTLDGDKAIGFVSLGAISWNNGDAWVGIGVWDAEYRGKGYGTDAMRLMLRYAFTELNLYRVTLGVFEYNPRAQRSYQKAGFVLEGRVREELNRNGRRWDGLYMGILREEWEAKQRSEGH